MGRVRVSGRDRARIEASNLMADYRDRCFVAEWNWLVGDGRPVNRMLGRRWGQDPLRLYKRAHRLREKGYTVLKRGEKTA